MPEGYLLTADELELLQRLLNDSRRRLQNPQARYDSQLGHRFAPEVYVAKSPFSGVPALVDSEDGSTAYPGKATCDIYYVTDLDSVERLTPYESQKVVYNLSHDDIPTCTWFIVLRDKAGRWWAAGNFFESGGTCEETGTASSTSSGTSTGSGTSSGTSTGSGTSTSTGTSTSNGGTTSSCGDCHVEIVNYIDVDIINYFIGQPGIFYNVWDENGPTEYRWKCRPDDGRCGWFNVCDCTWFCVTGCDTGTGTSTSTVSDPNTGTGTDGTFLWWCVLPEAGTDTSTPSGDCDDCCGEEDSPGFPLEWTLDAPRVAGFEELEGEFGLVSGGVCFWGSSTGAGFDWDLGRTLDHYVLTGFNIDGHPVQAFILKSEWNCCGTNIFTFSGLVGTAGNWNGQSVTIMPATSCGCGGETGTAEASRPICVYSDVRPLNVVGGPWATKEICDQACLDTPQWYCMTYDNFSSCYYLTTEELRDMIELGYEVTSTHVSEEDCLAVCGVETGTSSDTETGTATSTADGDTGTGDSGSPDCCEDLIGVDTLYATFGGALAAAGTVEMGGDGGMQQWAGGSSVGGACSISVGLQCVDGVYEWSGPHAAPVSVNVLSCTPVFLATVTATSETLGCEGEYTVTISSTP